MTPDTERTETKTDIAFDGLVVCAMKIAQKNAALRRDLIAAIQADDVPGVLLAACALARIEPAGSIRALIHSRAKAVASGSNSVPLHRADQSK